MKNRFFVIVLFFAATVAVGLNACGKKETKSSENAITSVTGTGGTWPSAPTGFEWTGTYSKAGLGLSEGEPIGSRTVSIRISEKATISGPGITGSAAGPGPVSVTGNFADGLSFVVTAEDNTPQTWTIKTVLVTP